MIEIENLTKEFNGNTAVDRLTLTIDAGEVFGFLGPNGAGKTTTVRMLTTLIAPTSGRASLMGYEVGRDDREIRRRVGLLTETPGMYDRLSAWKNLIIYGRLYEVDNPERQAEKYLRMLDLWQRRHDAAGTYSKGMKQKLAIARALLHEPPILFLDEPTAGLDPEASRMLREFIGQLRGEGRTIFLCTHNLDEADRLCDRIAVFKSRLRVVDAPSNLWQRRHDAAGTYSKGMKQKLAIARALLHEPPILFLDEPTAGLDPEASRMLREFIGQLRGEGRTIFLCTHNLDEADRLCDRIAVFKSRLRVVDAPSNLRQQMYGRQIIFHLAHPADAFLPTVADLPYVQQSQATDSKLLLSLDDPEQHNPDLIRRLVNAGAEIQFVGEARRTLEEIYLQLVQEEEVVDGQN